jgi:hypothetical protein
VVGVLAWLLLSGKSLSVVAFWFFNNFDEGVNYAKH